MSGSRYTGEYERFRDAIVQARLQANLSQEVLAARLGKPQSFVSKYERGERRLDVVEFVRICECIGTPPGDLLCSIWPQRGSNVQDAR